MLVVFVPNLRRLAADHGVAGWVVAILVSTAALALGEQVHTSRQNLDTGLSKANARVQELEARIGTDDAASDAAARAAALRKDLALVEERLDGWSLNGNFFNYLVEDVDHSRLRASFAHDLDERWRKWEVDDRAITDPSLARSWEEVRQAVTAYSHAIGDDMWVAGLGPGRRTDSDHLEVPPEWEMTDHLRFIGAHDTLTRRRRTLIDALRHLFKVVHRLQ